MANSDSYPWSMLRVLFFFSTSPLLLKQMNPIWSLTSMIRISVCTSKTRTNR